MREYRKLDDSITMRLNRTTAQFRDLDRTGGVTGKGNVQDQACLHIWRELVGASFQLMTSCSTSSCQPSCYFR
jgi:hypothetical protein